MASSEVTTFSQSISSVEESDIDRDRIVDDHLVPDEYFCPICRCLLWKPRSCASCQNLFCQKCIRTWLENANRDTKCPFRCEPYEERRCPPILHALLGRLHIHCRNSSFGCTQVLLYNSLEQHENVECEYLTRRCSECEQLVLRSKLNEHRDRPGLCVPYPIKCTICQCYIEKSLFRDHFHGCCQQKLNELLEQVSRNDVSPALTNNQLAPFLNGQALVQNVVNIVNLFEQQRQMSRLPTSLVGVDTVRRAREQGCGHFYHIFIMFKFLLANWTKAPFFIFMFSVTGFSALGLNILGGYIMFSHWVYSHVYRGCFLIMLLSFLFTHGTTGFFRFASDMTIILCFGVVIFLCGCAVRMSLELLEMNALINKTTINVVLCCVGVLIIKMILLLVRLYYWCIPIYLADGFLALISIYLVFKAHRFYTNVITASVIQATTTV